MLHWILIIPTVLIGFYLSNRNEISFRVQSLLDREETIVRIKNIILSLSGILIEEKRDRIKFTLASTTGTISLFGKNSATIQISLALSESRLVVVSGLMVPLLFPMLAVLGYFWRKSLLTKHRKTCVVIKNKLQVKE